MGLKDDDGGNKPHRRIHPGPAELPRCKEPGDDKHRDCRIRHHVDKSSSQVVVAVIKANMRVVVVMMLVTGMMLMVTLIAQQIRRKEIDAQSKRGDRDRLVEGNRYGPQQASHALVPDQQRDHG